MPIFENVTLLLAALGTVAGLLLIVSIAALFSRFYRRCGADEALVRTGSGGNKVIIGGGVLVYPILHQLLRVSLRSVKLSVERDGKNALVTADKIKANVTTELYIKVEPLAEDVLSAARSFGERNLDEHAIAELIEGKLTDALRSVSANQTFMALHANRKQFAERIQEALAEELKKNGLTLENVSITGFAMVPVKELDPNDVFDAEGLRAITESVQTNREMTNKVQRAKENQIQEQNVLARRRQLELEQDQKQAEADQTRRVAEYCSFQEAETAKAVLIQDQARDLASLEKQRAVETARIEQEKLVAVAHADRERVVQAAAIEREKAVEAAVIEKQKAIEAAAIDKEKAIEVARISKQIAITRSEEEKARADAAKALALADEERAKQSITTAEALAAFDRDKLREVTRAQAEAEVQRTQAEAALVLAHATAERAALETNARRAALEAENTISARVLLRDVVFKTLELAPAITRELMAPAHAIREIKVLHTTGLGAPSANGDAPLGAASPIVKTLLEAGAAYPLFRELLGFAKVDGQALATHAKGIVGDVTKELEAELVEDVEAPFTNSEATPERDAAE